MHTEVTVDRGTLVAQEDPDIGRRPLGILTLAIEAYLYTINRSS